MTNFGMVLNFLQIETLLLYHGQVEHLTQDAANLCFQWAANARLSFYTSVSCDSSWHAMIQHQPTGVHPAFSGTPCVFTCREPTPAIGSQEESIDML
jgi:hypothetical protein